MFSEWTRIEKNPEGQLSEHDTKVSDTKPAPLPHDMSDSDGPEPNTATECPADWQTGRYNVVLELFQDIKATTAHQFELQTRAAPSTYARQSLADGAAYKPADTRINQANSGKEWLWDCICQLAGESQQ
ncbi:hypothetical protein PT974_09679 [Cladobotryum mycophilum]|uniref:Uncharacterized protein n=1 Tax=Cladobotryum mycophilum TaxID=491253 RepID=A0ABR0SGW8_9HYPO